MTTKVPSIPAYTGQNADTVFQNIIMTLNVREGRVGDKLDKGVTFRDLALLGLASDPNGAVKSSYTGALAAGIPVFSGEADSYDGTTDLTPPPSPTEVTLTPSIGLIYIYWNQPTYRNHSYAEIWRGSAPDVASAVLIGTSASQFYVDSPTNPDVTHYYWVRFVSRANVNGPYNSGLNSAKAEVDPAVLVKQIEGQILESSLSKTLSSRIQSIEDGFQNVGPIQQAVTSLRARTTEATATLSAAINAEQTARTTADTALASDITTLTSTVNTNNQTLTTALQTEATTRANADGSLFAQYTVKIDSNGHVSGFGLASETVSGTTTSAFIIRADKFAVVDPASTSNNLTNSPSTDTVPFSIVGGVTYLKSAMIQDASISSAKIASLVANKITSGYINAAVGINGAKVYGAELYAGGSTTVTTDAGGNVTGFTAVNPTVNISGGNASFVAGNFSVKNSSTGSAYVPFTVNGGVVYLNTAFIGDGTITNAKIGSTIQSTSYTAGSAGWKIDKDGASEFNSNVTFRGSLNVKSASSGARMEMTNSVLKVYDSSGTLRVKIGDLTA